MKKTIKKVLTGMLILVLLMTLAACGQGPESTESPVTAKTEKTDEEVQKETVAAEIYRSVKVLGVKGTVTVSRDEEEFSAYEEMMINGGDRITTGNDGILELKMDEDKYARIEKNSIARFELEGNTEKGAIRIYLEKGRIYNEIENPLSEEDNYEIHTPDAVMAVRGTKFWVYTGEMVNGQGRETNVRVEEGKVLVTLLESTGEGAERLLEAGDSTTILHYAGETDEPFFVEPYSGQEKSSLSAGSGSEEQQNKENSGVIDTDSPSTDTITETVTRTASVTEIAGEVYLVRADEVIPLTKDIVVQQGDVISTGSGEAYSYVELLLDQDKKVMMDDEAEAEFTTMEGEAGSEKTIITLNQGYLYSFLESGLSGTDSFVVVTPEGANVSVKNVGTMAEFSVNAELAEADGFSVTTVYLGDMGELEIALNDSSGTKVQLAHGGYTMAIIEKSLTEGSEPRVILE